MLMIFPFANHLCLEEDFISDSVVQSTYTVVKKHVSDIIKGKISYEKIPEIFSYAQRRLDDRYKLWRWIEMSDETEVRCGLYLWVRIYRAFPEFARRSDRSLIDSSVVLFSSLVRDSLRSGAYIRVAEDTTKASELAAWDILAISSFLNYLRHIGVEEFRKQNTCGYW